MTEAERRRLVEILIDEVQIYPERQPNGQWLKSIRFKLPLIDHDIELSLDNQNRVDTAVVLGNRATLHRVMVDYINSATRSTFLIQPTIIYHLD